MVSNNKTLTINELVEEVKSKSGRARGWPQDLKYKIENDSITISLDSHLDSKKTMRRIDPWGLAFLVYAESRCNVKIHRIKFSISGNSSDIWIQNRLVPNIEAFRRRISFLNINNIDLDFEIIINDVLSSLYSESSLFNRPENEIIRTTLNKPQDNQVGRLEKDFQTWLNANDVKDAQQRADNTNTRLAVLGSDFFQLNKKKFGILREFPTGSFENHISNSARILPTEFVDIVTLNKFGHLAVIELKLNDSQLEVIAQLTDYALFFRCYREKLLPAMEEHLRHSLKSKSIVCYVVNNHFHDRFDEVLKFYTPSHHQWEFMIKKVLLGAYS